MSPIWPHWEWTQVLQGMNLQRRTRIWHIPWTQSANPGCRQVRRGIWPGLLETPFPEKAWRRESSASGVGSLLDRTADLRTTTPMQAWFLIQPLTTIMWNGVRPSHNMCGSFVHGKSLIFVSISVTMPRDGAGVLQPCAAAPVGWWAADYAPWANAAAASTWHVKHI
eukprot:5456458-Amphidinium_carterae.1